MNASAITQPAPPQPRLIAPALAHLALFTHSGRSGCVERKSARPAAICRLAASSFLSHHDCLRMAAGWNRRVGRPPRRSKRENFDRRKMVKTNAVPARSGAGCPLSDWFEHCFGRALGNTAPRSQRKYKQNVSSGHGRNPALDLSLAFRGDLRGAYNPGLFAKATERHY